MNGGGPSALSFGSYYGPSETQSKIPPLHYKEKAKYLRSCFKCQITDFNISQKKKIG